MSTINSALSTVARFKTWFEISGNSKNAKIEMILIGVSDFVSRYCGYKFKRQAYVNQEYDGHGSETLYLKNKPVISGQSLSIQHRVGQLGNDDDWETIDADQYRVDYNKGRIVMNCGFFKGKQNYRVSYTAGYYVPSDAEYQDGTDDDLDLPYDLEMSVLKISGYSFGAGKSIGIRSEKVRDLSVTYADAVDKDAELKKTLDLYKRMSYS